MTVRSMPKTSIVWGRRSGRDGRSADHGSAGTRQASEAEVAAARSRGQGGQSQDRALYTCSCGFAFDALVSTSVGCPHCGSTQAW